eukprot:830387-Alexandrium_andersonii.AAC.1
MCIRDRRMPPRSSRILGLPFVRIRGALEAGCRRPALFLGLPGRRWRGRPWARRELAALGRRLRRA